MPELAPLSHRAHLQERKVYGKPLILYEDHRALTYVLWHANRTGLLSAPPLLVMFDRHDDCKAPSPRALQRAAELRQSGTERAVHEFVEWDLSPLDDDWVRASFELGILSHVILIGAEHHSNTEARRTTFTDSGGSEHIVWRIGHLWDALDHRGDLSDFARHAELQELWRALEWPPRGYREEPPDQTTSDTPIVLDFDLDCFSGTIGDHHMAWPPELIHACFNRRPRGGLQGSSALEFLEHIESRVKLRTIARESQCCGGTRESQGILETLDAVLWHGELFAIR